MPILPFDGGDRRKSTESYLVVPGCMVATLVFCKLVDSTAFADNLIYPWSVTTTLCPKAILIDAAMLLLVWAVSDKKWESFKAANTAVKPLHSALCSYFPSAQGSAVAQHTVWYLLFSNEICCVYALYATSERSATERTEIGALRTPSADIRAESLLVFSLPLLLAALVNTQATKLQTRSWLMALISSGISLAYLMWYGILSANPYRHNWDKAYITS